MTVPRPQIPAEYLARFDQAWAGSCHNLRMVIDAYLQVRRDNPHLPREALISGMAEWVEDNIGHEIEDGMRTLAEMVVVAAVQTAERTSNA